MFVLKIEVLFDGEFEFLLCFLEDLDGVGVVEVFEV